MTYYTKNTDLAITEDGDLLFTVVSDDLPTSIDEYIDPENGTTDLTITRGSEEIIQNIMIRLKTNLMELLLHDDIGNRLINIVGKRNTRENAELGKSYLAETILRYNMVVKPDHLSIEATPISPDVIAYVIKIYDGPFDAISMVLELDLKDGIRRVL